MTRARLKAVLAASPSLLFAVLAAKLWLSGTLGYYVNDRTIWIVLGGSIVFATVGIAAIRRALIDPEAESGLSWRTIAFLIPVIVGIAVPASPLSASSGQSSSLGSLQLASHVSSGGGGDRFGYWMNMLADHPNPSWWKGRHVTLVGFVAHEQGIPDKGFIVGRWLVTCCVMDATLLGFPVRTDSGRSPAENAWVQISGVFSDRYWEDPNGGQQYPLILHAKIAPVSIPSSPYLSP